MEPGRRGGRRDGIQLGRSRAATSMDKNARKESHRAAGASRSSRHKARWPKGKKRAKRARALTREEVARCVELINQFCLRAHSRALGCASEHRARAPPLGHSTQSSNHDAHAYVGYSLTAGFSFFIRVCAWISSKQGQQQLAVAHTYERAGPGHKQAASSNAESRRAHTEPANPAHTPIAVGGGRGRYQPMRSLAWIDHTMVKTAHPISTGHISTIGPDQ